MGKYFDEYYQQHCLPIECPICGKKFIPAPEHRWQIGQWGVETRHENVCSYTCMRKWEKEQEAKAKTKEHANKSRKCPKYTKKSLELIYSRLPSDVHREIAKLYFEDRLTQEQIAENHGHSCPTVQRYIREIRDLIKGMDDIKYIK
jgi:DNA-directed RNA polymerase specialized sigma subunit